MMEMMVFAPFGMASMFFLWLAGIISLVATVLAIYYYIAGKEEEYRRAGKIVVISLGVVLVLIGFLAVFLMPVLRG